MTSLDDKPTEERIQLIKEDIAFHINNSLVRTILYKIILRWEKRIIRKCIRRHVIAPHNVKTTFDGQYNVNVTGKD